MAAFKKYALLLTYGIVLFLGLKYISDIFGAFRHLIAILFPVILGFCMAFILNILMSVLERKLFPSVDKKGRPKEEKGWYKYRRILSLVMTYVLTLSLLTLIIIFIVPQLTKSASQIIDNLPEYAKEITAFTDSLDQKLGLSSELVDQIVGGFNALFLKISEITGTTILKVFDFTLKLTSTAFNVFIGTVFSVYFLLRKERLIAIVKKLNIAFNKPQVASYLTRIATLSNQTFKKYVGGQIIESMILGVLCYLGMVIIGIPYAPLVSTLIGVTALIPNLGAYIGTIPSLLIIATDRLSMALIFLLFIVILQQFENNIIYPKVVGEAVGIDGFWVFLAIIVGGGLFGLIGMLMGVPLMAVLYALIRDVVNGRIVEKEKKKNIKPMIVD